MCVLGGEGADFGRERPALGCAQLRGMLLGPRWQMEPLPAAGRCRPGVVRSRVSVCPARRAAGTRWLEQEKLGAGPRFLTYSSCYWIPVIPGLSHSSAWGENPLLPRESPASACEAALAPSAAADPFAAGRPVAERTEGCEWAGCGLWAPQIFSGLLFAPPLPGITDD